MQIETTQVRLRLVGEKDVFPDGSEGREVLNEIKKRNKKEHIWLNDEIGKYISIMYDAHEFRFRPGKAITVGKVVANALRRSSALMIGPDYLNGPILPMIVVDKEFTLGEELVDGSKPMTQTTCSVCFVDQLTLPKLMRHLEKHRSDHPELFEEPDALPWDGEGEIANPLVEADGADGE
jgi:hypothetical protein